MATKTTSGKRKAAEPDYLNLPAFGDDIDLPGFDDVLGFPGLDAELSKLPELPGFDVDFEALGLSVIPQPHKNVRARGMGSATATKQKCGAKTRTDKPCKAPGNGKGGRCKMHGGMSTGPRTQEGKTRSLAALHVRRN